jgi:hypothetical protein
MQISENLKCNQQLDTLAADISAMNTKVSSDFSSPPEMAMSLS